MRQTLVVIASILVLLTTQPAAADIYQSTLQEAGQPTGEVTTEELQAILETGSAVVFDARPQAEFAVSHIPGALNVAPRPGVPISQYTSDVAEIGRLLNAEKSRSIVLYCNGPFCGKLKRLATDLLAAGYTNVRRYQLGMPVWRALIGVSQIETDAVVDVYGRDRTAWFVDARPTGSRGSTLKRSYSIAAGEVAKAKDDGRLPMEDHNTRLIVFGATPAQARAVATEIAKNAFSNVTFWAGSADDLIELLNPERGGPRERD
jgi:rhodanese-related sulfurtransferase